MAIKTGSCDYNNTFHAALTYSFQRHLDFSGEHSATLQLLRQHYSFTYPPPSLDMHSLTQLSELWQRGVNEIVSKRQQENSNLGSLD